MGARFERLDNNKKKGRGMERSTQFLACSVNYLVFVSFLFFFHKVIGVVSQNHIDRYDNKIYLF